MKPASVIVLAFIAASLFALLYLVGEAIDRADAANRARAERQGSVQSQQPRLTT